MAEADVSMREDDRSAGFLLSEVHLGDEPNQAGIPTRNVDRSADSTLTPNDLSPTQSHPYHPQPDMLVTAMREVVRTELHEALDGMLKDMLLNLHDLSVALKSVCEFSANVRNGRDGVVWESASGDDKSESNGRSISASEGSSVSGFGSERSLCDSSHTEQHMSETVRRALRLRISMPTPRSALAASSSATRPEAGRVDRAGNLSPILSQSPSECSHSPKESRPALVTPVELLKDEEPKAQAEVAGTSLVKEPHPIPELLEGVGNVPIVVEGGEPVSDHHGSEEFPRSTTDQRRAFSEFEKRKAEAGNRTPCSLLAMEDARLFESMEKMLVSREKMRWKEKSKKRKHAGKHRDFASVVPDKVQGSGPLEDAPENKDQELLPGSLQEIMDDAAKPRENINKAACYASEPHAESDPTGSNVSRRLRSLGRLRSDHAQDVLDDYTGLKPSTSKVTQKCIASIGSSVDYTCKSCLWIRLKEFPEYCLAAFGITQLGNSFWSRLWVSGMALARTGAVIFIIVKDSMRFAETSQTLYTSSVHAFLALGTSLSMFCLRAGNNTAVFGGHCDAIRMYADEKYFLDAWRTRSFLYFCITVATCAVQFVLLVHRFPGSVSEECEDVGLAHFEPTMHVAHLIVVGTMAMLVFLHLRICVGLQLMVDSFCEDFKMGMDDMRAALDWSTINGVMSKTTNILGTSFLIQISAVAAALVPAAADVLVGNVGEGSPCFSPWLVHWVTPALLGLLLNFAALVQSGRLTLKCSSVAGFVLTVRYKEGRSKDVRDLRQYLVNFIQQSSSGFLVQGSRVTTFAAFKLGWCFLTAIFAVWARSRSN